MGFGDIPVYYCRAGIYRIPILTQRTGEEMTSLVSTVLLVLEYLPYKLIRSTVLQYSVFTHEKMPIECSFCIYLEHVMASNPYFVLEYYIHLITNTTFRTYI